jgi:hypothetical protein
MLESPVEATFRRPHMGLTPQTAEVRVRSGTSRSTRRMPSGKQGHFLLPVRSFPERPCALMSEKSSGKSGRAV